MKNRETPHSKREPDVYAKSTSLNFRYICPKSLYPPARNKNHIEKLFGEKKMPRGDMAIWLKFLFQDLFIRSNRIEEKSYEMLEDHVCTKPANACSSHLTLHHS